jgi:hypothetical protein
MPLSGRMPLSKRKTTMKRCLYCKKPFGLVRKTFGIFWWTKEFCSKQCSNNYVKECQEREKVKQFLIPILPQSELTI